VSLSRTWEEIEDKLWEVKRDERPQWRTTLT